MRLKRRTAETLAAIAAMPIRVVFDQFDEPFAADDGFREFHILIIRAFWRRHWLRRSYRRPAPEWMTPSHLEKGWVAWEVGLTDLGRAALEAL